MARKEKRFLIHQEGTGFGKGVTILFDRMTGVQYLFYQDGYAGGLTPLLDADGKPFIQPLPDGGDDDE